MRLPKANRALWAFGSIFAVSSGVAFCLLLLFLFRPSGQAQSSRPPAATDTLIVPDSYPSIQEAVTAAKEGTVVKVRPGEYQEWVNITKPLTLEAEAKGEVLLVAPSDASPALSVTDAINIRISGFRLRHPAGPPKKDACPPVVDVRRSDVLFTGCEVTGAAEDGVRCTGGGRVRLEDCTISGNAYHGLAADRGAQVETIGCRFERNGGSGLLALLGAAALIATDCRMTDNGASGAEVNRGGKGTFTRCEFLKNAKAGLLVEGTSCEVSVVSSLFQNNQVHGLQVAEGAILKLSDCVVEANRETGLALYDPGSGSAVTGGKFRKNGHFGILLEAKEAIAAMVEGVDASENQITGIVVKGPVTATVRRNTCTDNSECGMLLMNGTSGEVTDNRCQRNSSHGIALDSVSSSLRIDGNDASSNKGNAVFRR